jgi:hypothetical protein
LKYFGFNGTSVKDIVKWLESKFSGTESKFADFQIPDIENAWMFENEDISISIMINTSEPRYEYIHFSTVICEIPNDNILPFYRKCLEINKNLIGAVITLDDSKVCFDQLQFIKFISKKHLDQMFEIQIKLSANVLDDLANEFEIIHPLLY